ncbi:MAG: endonuclease/exonuclease/phosphatase family protein [Chloroflexota bacterium]
MTLNIWNYTSPWPDRRALIARAITDRSPDVVALQEARHDFRFDHGRGQAEQIADLTGYCCTWALAQVYVPILRLDEGLAILTREPPMDVAEQRLSHFNSNRHDENRRICLSARVQIYGRVLDIYNTHFSLSPAAQRCNAREVLAFIRRRSSGRPAVLMGDLNAEPASPAIDDLVTGGLLDCWRSANPHEPGFTYSSYRPVRRIDYVMGQAVRVANVSLAANKPIGGTYPSDHLGVVVDLERA